jgi:acetylornithine deacetylase/succinyl-diaminopimelate desuccinylase-like protein
MDWSRLLDEATRHLRDYIRINTVNPPGNEIEGARFFQTRLEAEDISCEISEPASGRGNLLAILKGDGTKKPVLLLNHIDVVPAESAQWEVDPFGGVLKDGYIYGRGALDDKSMGIVQMMVLLALKREGIPLKRDILFFAANGEETGGEWGVEWAVEHVPQLLTAEYVLNEGGYVILDEKGTANRYEISSGQKVMFQLRAKTTGTSGHASMPLPDNPNVKLVRALNRLTKWETPFVILPMVDEYFRRLAPTQSMDQRSFYENIGRGLENPSFSKQLNSNPLHAAMVRSTVALTVLQSGSKMNVVPSEATALIDCRLIPGTSKPGFLKEIRKKLGRDVEVEVVSESDSHPPSPVDTDLFRAIQNFAARRDPGCPVLPHLLAGGTDGRFFRKRGMTTYDFCPFRLTEKEMLRIHGNNERIALENLEFGMRLTVEVVREIAT